MSLFRSRFFSSVAFGHLAVDILNGTRGVLLAFWSIPLGLSNSAIGLISTLYAFASSLAQPIFGLISDRIGVRWVAAGGILWMGIFFALAVTTPGYTAVIFLIIGSVGSGAFHPAGVATSTLVGRSGMAGREASAASFFFLFGQSGWFLGPLLGGALLNSFQTPGLLILVAALAPVGAYAVLALRNAPVEDHPVVIETAPRRKVEAGTVIALVLVAACQSWAQANVTTFMPKYLSDLGQPAAIYGLLTSLFMGGSAIGNVIGGNLADRIGKTRVMTVTLAMAVVPMFFLWQAHGSIGWYYLLIPLSGAFTGAAFPVIVVLSQKLVPVGMALASGLIMGFTFAAGAAGAWLSGVMADQTGVPAVFLVCAAVCLIGALASQMVRETATERVSIPVKRATP